MTDSIAVAKCLLLPLTVTCVICQFVFRLTLIVFRQTFYYLLHCILFAAIRVTLVASCQYDWETKKASSVCERCDGIFFPHNFLRFWLFRIWSPFHKETYDKNHRKSISRTAHNMFNFIYRIKIFAYSDNIF